MNAQVKSQAHLVTYALVDGIHVFTGASAMAKGVFVAHKDLKTAFDEVAVQLNAIGKVNYGVTTNVSPVVPFEQFSAWVYDAKAPPKNVRAKADVEWAVAA